MTATPFPYPRETRESTKLVGNGTPGPYGPSTFKIFDTADVVILARAAADTVFADVTLDATVTKSTGAAFDTFSVTFAAAVPATTDFFLQSRRVHERQTAVTKGGAISALQLEKELSKQGTVIEELRRDVDRGLSFQPDYDGDRGLPAVEPGKVIGWKTDGGGLENKTLVATTVPMPTSPDRYVRLNGAGLPDVVTAQQAANLDALAGTTIAPGDAGKLLTVKGDLSGYELSATVPDGSVTDIKVAVPPTPADAVLASKIRFRRSGVGMPSILLSERLKDLPFLEDWGGAGVPVGGVYVDNAAAFTAALTEVGKGGLILVRAGLIYGTTQTVKLNDGQMLEGFLQHGYDYFGANPVIGAGAGIRWMGGGGGTVMEFGADDAPVFTDTVGGGVRNLQIYGTNVAARVLRVKACTNATFENLKVAYPNGGFALELTANPTTQGAPYVNNTIRGCSFRNINIFCNGNASGIRNYGNGTEGGITQSRFDNIVVQYGYSGTGSGIYLSAMDSSVWSAIKITKGAGTNTGVSLSLDGSSAGKQVQGNLFDISCGGNNSVIFYDGPTSRQNKMTIAAVDYEPTILRGSTTSTAQYPASTGAELWYEFLGTTEGSNGTLINDKAYNRVPPLRIRGYAHSDPNTLDQYNEGTATPGLTFGGAAVGMTFAKQLTEYTLIGDTVFGQTHIQLSAKGSSTGVAQITALPYVKKSATPDSACSIAVSGMTSGVGDTHLQAWIAPGNASIKLYKVATGSEVQLTEADFTANSTVRVDWKYKIA